MHYRGDIVIVSALVMAQTKARSGSTRAVNLTVKLGFDTSYDRETLPLKVYNHGTLPMDDFVIAMEADPRLPGTSNKKWEWSVDHSIASEEWYWYAIWVENAFAWARLANGSKLPPAQDREHRPDECVNFVAYRAWLIEHCPGAKFVATIDAQSECECIKIVFASYRQAIEHMLMWQGPGSPQYPG